MSGIQEPIHVEAQKLGANLTEIRKKLPDSYINRRRAYSAKEILAVWDYRKAGLTVDQARDKVFQWVTTRGVHCTPIEPKGGEIASLGQRRDQIARRFEAFKQEIATLPIVEAGSLSWDRPKARIEADGRTIVVVRREDVTWPETKYGRSARWPASKQVSYVSHLIRLKPPDAMTVQRLSLYAPQYPSETLDMFTEKQVTHTARGNWVREVADKLLGKKPTTDVRDPYAWREENARRYLEERRPRPDDRSVQKSMNRRMRHVALRPPRLTR